MKEGGMKVREIMTAQPKTASRNTTLAAAAHLVALDTMASQRVRRLPVTENGALVGIISMNDLVLAAGADKTVRNDEVVAALKAICAHHAAPAAAAA
jgi:signal-transduction protein with cAMP-binding, CBS, and nucleotidyltransferase domain